MDPNNTTINDKSAHEKNQPDKNAGPVASLAEVLNDACNSQIFAVDRDLKVIAWNKATAKARGVERGDAIGRSMQEVLPELMANPRVKTAFEEALEGRKSVLKKEQSQSGKEYHDYHFIPIHHDPDENEATGVMVIGHDVSQAVISEERLQSLNNELLSKNRQLSQKTAELSHFNKIASHDLKEPLRKIYTLIEMVTNKEGKKLSVNGKSNLRRAQSAVQRMGLLADDIVKFSRITIADTSLTEVDLQAVHARAMEARQGVLNESAAVIVSGTLPVIVAYAELIDSLWLNMLECAFKLYEDGSAPHILVSYHRVAGADIRLEEADPAADYHRISFLANGVDEASCGKLAEMVQHLESEEDFRTGGIGLAICRKIAAAHDGFMTLSTEHAEGGVFCCYLREMRAG